MISPQKHIFNFFTIVIILFNNVGQGTTSSQDELPYCGLSEKFDRFLLVSTLDGKLTALNPDNEGTELWNVHPGNEPMLSSSIHRLELTNYGQMVRMIPSLNGGLYKFNGETVEPIPLSADNLLQASLRYSDDLVISGGKESQTVGISLNSGKVLYECSMKGCKDDGERSSGDVLLVQRLGQVVRAVESRTGMERWNFSVAQHELKLISGCHTTDLNSPRLNVKVIVPAGVVCSMDPANPDLSLWTHKFDSPVVNVWEVQKDKVYKVDLFSRITTMSPSLYIGMHEKQLYIQESVTMLEKRQELALQYGKNYLTNEKDDNSLPWLPVIADAKYAGISMDDKNWISFETPVEESSTTALSVLYASPYIDGMGFYLYSKQAIQEANEASCNITIDLHPKKEEESEETPVTIVIVSLWYWWREVTIISFTTAVVFNLIFTRRFLRLRNQSLLPTAEQRVTGSDSGVSIESKISESVSNDYKSRYLTDFDPVNCLGKGGFGVVFEARNKIDDCHYAIKRIILPDAPESRERVMREVRALAKLDHNNIVRYFNSWMECPPAVWQREQDRKHIREDDFETNCLSSEAVTDCYPSPSMSPTNETSNIVNSHSMSLKCDDDSDSFIVFGNDSSQSEAENEKKDHTIIIEDSESSKNGTSSLSCKKLETNKAIWSEHNAICQSPSKVYLYIQMQLCRKESLKDWLLQNPNRNYFNILEIFEQIVSAVYYVHENNLIHRDLKPSNIFFSMDSQIKVGDFGLVTTIVEDTERKNIEEEKGVRKKHTSQVGTQLYMSPEQLSGQPYSYKVDIFSLGLILFELLVPFSTQMERLKTLEDIRQHKFPLHFTNKFKTEHDLLQKMLSHTPGNRPNTSDLLTGPPLMQDSTGEASISINSYKRHRRQSSRNSGSSISGSELCLGPREHTT